MSNSQDIISTAYSVSEKALLLGLETLKSYIWFNAEHPQPTNMTEFQAIFDEIKEHHTSFLKTWYIICLTSSGEEQSFVIGSFHSINFHDVALWLTIHLAPAELTISRATGNFFLKKGTQYGLIEWVDTDAEAMERAGYASGN